MLPEVEDAGPSPEELNAVFGHEVSHQPGLIKGMKKSGALQFIQYLKDHCAGEIDGELNVHLTPITFSELDDLGEEFLNS